MRKVWKYPLEFPASIIAIPKGGQILDLQKQGGYPCLWVLLDPDAEKELRRFRVIGTGHRIDNENLEYVGTWQEAGFVWHLFEQVDT